ncbi:MAG: type II secretion system F family protein [Sulfuriferula sp.]|nr:type II secretion system F family protein [Sulfuriferula sp.]
MASFRYLAVNAQGRRQRGVCAAAHELDLSQRLAGMGLDLISAHPVRAGAKSTLTNRALISLFVHLAHLSRAGIALLDGVRDLRDSLQAPPLRHVLAGLLADMEAGRSLSMSMAAQTPVFDTLMVGLVRAGEATGEMGLVLTHLADSLKRQDELRIEVQRLLIYPALVLVMVAAVVLMLLLFLIPQIVQLMTSMGMAIPLTTKIMLSVSVGVREYGWLMLLLASLSVVAVALLYRHHAGLQYWLDGIKLRIPVLGGLLQKVDLARFADFFALMYQSGIPVFDALALSADLVRNRVLAAAIRRARVAVINGERLSVAFAHERILPALVVGMLRIGETTGALDSALLEVRYFYQRDVSETTARWLKLLEPLLTLVLGVILAAMIGMVLLPLYAVLGTVQL